VDNNHTGCTIDNIKIKTKGDGSTGDYEYWSGTSMAAPHVSGLAALAWAYKLNLSAAAVKDAVINQGDDDSSLTGRTLTGKRINANGTLNYLKSAKQIIVVDLTAISESVIVDDVEHTVVISVPYGTSLTSVVPTIDHNGASISPASGVAQNFTSSVEYTVTATDASTQAWTVSVTVLANTAKEITAFSLNDLAEDGIIDEAGHTIAINVSYGTNVVDLVPTITITGNSVSPASGIAQDFTNPVTYTVTAENDSTQAYAVTVTVGENPFAVAKVKFRDGSGSSKTTSKTKISLDFSGIGNSTEFIISKSADFSGASWRAIKDSTKVTIKKKSGKQKFYIKFRNADGIESQVFTKTLQYKVSKRVLKVSKKRVSKGDILVESGKNFSKNSEVVLYFSKPGGGYYAPKTVTTSKKGAFSISYRVNNPPGAYNWYAIDKKTGKTTKKLKYTIK